MPVNAYDVSAGLFVRGLTNLDVLLAKAQVHGEADGESGRDASAALLGAQLAEDMNDLSVQVHWAAEGARTAVARLCGTTPAPSPNDAKSFAELRQRLTAAIEDLRAVEPSELEAGLERTIEIAHRGGSMKFVGHQFLLEFAIPSFFFHLTTAYAILRHEGVALTKGDFLGGGR